MTKKFPINGRKTLEDILRSSCYGSLSQAVASLTIFAHPNTVAQIGRRSIFRLTRNTAKRGKSDDLKKSFMMITWVHI